MIKKLLLSAVFSLLAVSPAFALDKPFDHSLFDQFLKKYVNEAGDVNYAAAKNEPLLDQYLKTTRKIREKDFISWPREEQIALAINAYHAALIKKVLEHYPIKTVQSIPGFWQMDAVPLGPRKKFSFNGLRQNYLIKGFRDVKFHMALSNAAKGGPRLSRDAYTGPKLDAQLFLAAKQFVNDPSKNRIETGKKKIYLSKIFEWYGLDFTLDFGAFENEKNLSQQDYAILSFVANYLSDEEKIRYLEDGRYKVKYLNFDWALNDSSAPAQA